MRMLKLLQKFARALAALALIHGAAVEAATYSFPNQTLTVPDGFEVTLAAASPLVERPIEADFDEQGRLFVSDSSGFSGKAQDQLKLKPHRILRLEDSDGDGRFDKSVVFADKMMFPEGVMCHEGAVYVAAPPEIWKLEDLDDDGVADKRTVWHDGKTLTGCANDLHGPYLGPDGWIYWCKGAFAEQTYTRPGDRTVTDAVAHIYRKRVGGDDFDSVMSGGMDNPVGIAFSATGEIFFTTTFYVRPRAGQRDALVHAIYGGVYPKVRATLEALTRTGDLMPAMTHLGAAVPCGITRYEARVLGAEYQGNLFSCQFNMHRVQRHVLRPMGSTFRTEDSDFLVSDNPDFHPTDVFEDADGSLLVIDTGGWYRVCCPTSQIAKPQVKGGIYRIRRKGAKAPADPRGRELAWGRMAPQELAALLSDPRPAVKRRAVGELGKQAAKALGALKKTLADSSAPEARLNAVWALSRIDGESARALTRTALDDSETAVVLAAIHCAGVHRDARATSGLIQYLRSDQPHVRRAAATALSQIRDSTATSALLDAANAPNDRPLEHSLIYALIETGDSDYLSALLARFPQLPARQRRAALIALDQIEGSILEPDHVVGFLDSTDPILRETAAWLTDRHPEWGGALAGFLQSQIDKPDLSAEERNELRGQLGRFAGDGRIQEIIAKRAVGADTPDPTRALMLGAMARSGLSQMPEAWMPGVQKGLSVPNAMALGEALAAVKALPLPKNKANAFVEPLQAIADSQSLSDELRLSALAAMPAKRAAPDEEVFDFLLDHIQPNRPPLKRSVAASVLSRARLNRVQRQGLADAMREVGPMELGKLLEAFADDADEATGLKLMASLEKSSVRASLRSETLKPRLAKYPESVRRRGERLLATLNPDAAAQKARLDELEAVLDQGDKNRGHIIFNSAQAACATCHSIGYLGGNMGPDLTRIGRVRTERDLLEAIVYPSSNFVRSYEPVILQTVDGEDYSGILRDETSESVVLVMGAGSERRFSRKEIAEITPGSVSTMPQGLDQQLSKQQMADLIVFLKSLQ